MLTLTHCLPANPEHPVSLQLPLTAEERTRSRSRLHTEAGEICLNLPRGTVLQAGDLLHDPKHDRWVRILAKPEPVLTITAELPVALLQAAYHLGNRHVTLEITPTYLRLAPDPVLKAMLAQLQLQIQEEIAPFQPEQGAYHHPHGH